MKLSMPLVYAGNPRETADQVVGLEKAGLDLIWVAEPYGFDAPTLMGYLAAKTETVQIGAGILNVYSRTPGALLQTAAGLDNVSGGRAVLGLGASGPQVIEGFHGLPYDRPLTRTREVIEVLRMGLRHEKLDYQGKTISLPLPEGEGLGLGKPLKLLNKPERPSVPLWVAALGDKNVAMTAEVADGWLPFLYFPEKAHQVWGEPLARGAAKRSADLAPLEICAGGMVAIGEGPETKELLQPAGLRVRLREGGQGDPGPLPLGQEEGGRGTGPARVARGGQPRGSRVLRQGAHRRVQGVRRDAPVGHPGQRRPGRHHRPDQGVGVLSTRGAAPVARVRTSVRAVEGTSVRGGGSRSSVRTAGSCSPAEPAPSAGAAAPSGSSRVGRSRPTRLQAPLSSVSHAGMPTR